MRSLTSWVCSATVCSIAHERASDSTPAELVAYSTLDEAVSNIAVTVQRLNLARVLIVEDRALLHSSWGYQWISTELAQQTDALKGTLTVLSPQAATEEPVGGAMVGAAGDETERGLIASVAVPAALSAGISLIGAVPKLVGAVVDVVGMFRTNYSLAGRVMTPQGTPLVAEVARALHNRRVKTLVDGFHLAAESPLLARVAEAQRLRWEVNLAVSEKRARSAAAQTETKRLEAEPSPAA
jgi:hypothetical protein